VVGWPGRLGPAVADGRAGRARTSEAGTASGALERLLAADERAQALVLLAAGRAAVQVRP
jgi:hypothetical protein